MDQAIPSATPYPMPDGQGYPPPQGNDGAYPPTVPQGYPPQGYPPQGYPYPTSGPPPMTTVAPCPHTPDYPGSYQQQQPMSINNSGELQGRDKTTAERRSREQEQMDIALGLACGGILCCACVGKERAAVSVFIMQCIK